MKSINKTKEGDKIVIRLSNSDYRHVILKNNEFINTGFGQISHSLFINKYFNSFVLISKKYKNRNIETKFFILKPSYSHFFKTTERQTQILFMHDIAMIIYNLDIIGKNVLEAGTGSATLTRALSSLAKKVYTFEINESRYIKNKEMLKDYNNIIIKNENIFNSNIIERIFLDLPNPELLSNKISKLLKSGDKICIFIPSVEQIQLVVLNYKIEFKLKIFENISREILSKVYYEDNKIIKGIGYKNEDYLHTGYLIFGIKY